MGNGHCRDRDISGFLADKGQRDTWWAVGTAAVGAIAGAYSSNKQAKAAAAGSKGKTDQTTTQNPWLSDWYDEDINNVIQHQRGVVARGVPQLGPNGQLVYDDQLPWGQAGGNAQFAGSPKTAAAGVPAGYEKRPDGRVVKTVQAATGAGKGKGKGGGGKGGGAVKAGPASVSPAINYQDPTSVFGAVAQRGLDAGNSTTQTQARNAMGNILGAAGGGGPEQTGFEGYNPVLDRLTGRLEGNADRANARDLLLGFLNENQRGGVAVGAGIDPTRPTVPRPSGGSSGGGGGAIVRTSPQGTRAERLKAQQVFYDEENAARAAATTGASSAAGGAGVPLRQPGPKDVPDTMDVDTYFAEQTRKIMDEQANEAELEALIASMNEDTEKGMFRDLAQLDAAAQGSGRFGGDMWKGMNTDAREEALQEMNKTASGVRIGDRESRRQARLAALQGVNTRDLGLLGANVQREGIAAGERSANAAARASAGAAAAGADAQMQIAKRGQDLSAISQLLGNEEFNLGQLGQVGGQLSSDRLGTLGLVPGLEGIGLSGLQTALGAGGGLVDMRGQDINKQIAGQNANIQRQGLNLQQQGLNQQASIWNAGQQQQLVNNYLGTLQNIGSMGGTSHTVGTNVQPGLGVSPTGAAAMGALGGGLAAYGTYKQYAN